VYFSPLADRELPDADSVFLPGGYPELHLDELSGNAGMLASVRSFAAKGGKIYAECGGMLYLLESLEDKKGKRAEMAGVLPGRAKMQDKLVALGMQSAPMFDGELRGHTFHHSSLQLDLPVHARGKRQRNNRAGYDGEAIYLQGATIASYIHSYFPSHPPLMGKLFSAP